MRTYDERLKLYEENKGLAYSLSLKILKKNEKLDMWKDDLIQEALIELWRVTQTYSENKETKFSTYAYNNIWGAIQRHIDRVIIKRDRYTGEVPIVDTLDKPVNFSNSKKGEIKETVLDLLVYEYSEDDIDYCIDRFNHLMRVLWQAGSYNHEESINFFRENPLFKDI